MDTVQHILTTHTPRLGARDPALARPCPGSGPVERCVFQKMLKRMSVFPKSPETYKGIYLQVCRYLIVSTFVWGCRMLSFSILSSSTHRPQDAPALIDHHMAAGAGENPPVANPPMFAFYDLGGRTQRSLLRPPRRTD